MENTFEKGDNKKELLRKEIENEVEHIADKRGKKIDSGIKEAVIVLKLSGFETGGSCEGHEDRAHPYPWVDVIASTRNDARYKELTEKYKKEQFLTSSETEDGLLLDTEIAKKEKEIINRLEKLLGEFHENSGGEKLITIKKYASWYRIQPIGAEEFNAVKSDKELTEPEKQKRIEFLNKSQKEMENFIAFLNKKFEDN